jgi:hypothetical protein
VLESAIALLPYPEKKGMALITSMVKGAIPTEPIHYEEYFNLILGTNTLQKHPSLDEAAYQDADKLSVEEAQRQLNDALIHATLQELPVIAVVFYRTMDEITRIPELLSPKNMNIPLALNLMQMRVIQTLEGKNNAATLH